jgi:hypothetical protein
MQALLFILLLPVIMCLLKSLFPSLLGQAVADYLGLPLTLHGPIAVGFLSLSLLDPGLL